MKKVYVVMMNLFRHKLLDCIGDFGLMGGTIIGKSPLAVLAWISCRSYEIY